MCSWDGGESKVICPEGVKGGAVRREDWVGEPWAWKRTAALGTTYSDRHGVAAGQRACSSVRWSSRAASSAPTGIELGARTWGTSSSPTPCYACPSAPKGLPDRRCTRCHGCPRRHRHCAPRIPQPVVLAAVPAAPRRQPAKLPRTQQQPYRRRTWNLTSTADPRIPYTTHQHPARSLRRRATSGSLPQVPPAGSSTSTPASQPHTCPPSHGRPAPALPSCSAHHAWGAIQAHSREHFPPDEAKLTPMQRLLPSQARADELVTSRHHVGLCARLRTAKQ